MHSHADQRAESAKVMRRFLLPHDREAGDEMFVELGRQLADAIEDCGLVLISRAELDRLRIIEEMSTK